MTYLQYLTNHASTLTTRSVLSYSGQYSDQVLMAMPMCKSVAGIDILNGLNQTQRPDMLKHPDIFGLKVETDISVLAPPDMSERSGFLYFFPGLLLILQ